MWDYRHEAAAWDPSWQATCIFFHRDQINGNEGRTKLEECERSFVLRNVAFDIRPESLIRWIVSALYLKQTSCMRITIKWLDAPTGLKYQPGSAKITVVLQNNNALAAVHFHRNLQYDAY